MSSSDVESAAPLISGSGAAPRRRPVLLGLCAGLGLLALVVVAAISGSGPGPRPEVADSAPHGDGFPWTSRMLAWQKPQFHFRTVKNYMNDPSGPMYYKGWYHLFYQHNPNKAFWGNIAWGHAVSRDLINWQHLPVAISPDNWYDSFGDWTGSIIVMSDDRVVMLYTGGSTPFRSNEYAQIQNLAIAADPSDPLLLKWIKYENNPVLLPPKGLGLKDFRDPNPIWYNATDATWTMVIGSKNDSQHHTGIVLLYHTKDFINFDRLPHVLHSVDYVGMLECVELYAVAAGGPNANVALDNIVQTGGSVKHVLKASLNDEWHDYYAIGTYDPETVTWTPDDPTMDVGIGRRFDWGKFYASRTFYDPLKQRRILWGYNGEVDTERADVMKGWASLQGTPRTVVFDVKTGVNLITWPIEEIDGLRTTSKNFSDIAIAKGTTVELDVGDAYQIDIVAEFEISKESLQAAIEADVGFNCSDSDGAAQRGVLGPFGLLLLATSDLSEQTATYFYVSRGIDGSLETHLCQDEMRSSKATDIYKRVVGGPFITLDGELLSMRILVDHSIVETFAQGGRTSATSRIYPTEAIYENARVFLFNNATGADVTARSVKVWQMNSTSSKYYDFSGNQEQ